MIPLMHYVILFVISLIMNTGFVRDSMSNRFPSSDGSLSFMGVIVMTLILIASFAAYDIIFAGTISILGVKA